MSAPPSEAPGAGRMSDLLINGIPYDVYTPTTGNLDRIVNLIACKGSQVNGGGVVLAVTVPAVGSLLASETVNTVSVSAWREDSDEFAAGARGDVVVVQEGIPEPIASGTKSSFRP